MARGNLSACLAVTLPHEGGYVDHPKDPGGATNMGITFAVLQKWRGFKITKQHVKDLTLIEATRIYDKNYWYPVKGELLPYGVDLGVFDAAVNSGPSRGAKWLQRAVGVKQDGLIGNATLQATADQDTVGVIQRLCGYRLSFVQGLGTFKVFGRGWSRRIADIEAKGVAMYLRSRGMSASDAGRELAAQGNDASVKAGDQSKGAAAGGAGGAAVSVGDYAAGGTTWLLVVGAVVLVGAFVLVLKSRQNTARAEAYEAAMHEQRADALAGQ